MDHSEALAKRYLDTLDLGPVVFEPDGNVPPDFALKGNVAVEVRRLNQNHGTSDCYEGLEQLEAPLLRFVENLLPKFGLAPNGRGWWVSFGFHRPLDRRAIKRELPICLQAFCDAQPPSGARIQLTRGFRIDIQPASIPVENLLMLGGYSDQDAGGFVAAEIIRNLNICIIEKSAKIRPYRNRYDHWWLLLPDYIGPDLNIAERLSIVEFIDNRMFDRVILIHPRDPMQALVIGQ